MPNHHWIDFISETQSLSIETGKGKGASIRLQIFRFFQDAIESGQLSHGEPLPPTRELADQLKVSRDTVVRAYNMLCSSGLVAPVTTVGYFVRKEIPNTIDNTSVKRKLDIDRISSFARGIIRNSEKSPVSADFEAHNYGAPPQELLPAKAWRERTLECAKLVDSLHLAPELLGIPDLRDNIAEFVNRFKHVRCSGDSVVVYANTFAAINQICRLLLNPGDCIAIEDPGFGGIRNIASLQSLNLVPITVDESGLKVEDLMQCSQPVRLVYVTPTHQEPTGALLSIDRKKALVEWARKKNVWIIEDDYDGYFQYAVTRPFSLRALDEEGTCVIYMSTFWRLLYPLTSLGFCIFPQELIELVLQTKLQSEGIVESLPQHVLAKLLKDGEIEHLIQRLRRVYLKRRNTAISILGEIRDLDIQTKFRPSGTKALLWLNGYSEQEVLSVAQEVALPLISTRSFFTAPEPVFPYLLDFSVVSELELKNRISKFRSTLSTS